jgi:enoyl-CoA hydratase/carnithine racemase
MSTHQYIKVAEAPDVLRMVLAHPPLNILNIEMMEEINSVLESIRSKPQARTSSS